MTMHRMLIRRNLTDALHDALATYEDTKLYKDLRFARQIQDKIEVFDRNHN